jgi:hypothetical protein
MMRLTAALAVAAGMTAAPSLFGGSAVRANTEASYLLLDVTRGTVTAARWPRSDVPVPVGSLVKPFTAVAYGLRHQLRFPVRQCTGEDCWLKAGHGRIGLTEAIAQSCNSYFRGLTDDVTPGEVAETARRFGLRALGLDCARDALFGLGTAWRLSPLEVVRAYAELAARRGEPGVDEVISGMRLSATIGTARAIGAEFHSAAALAKTGTAPCSHSPKGAGDGYAVMIYPGDSPRYVLLVQVHGATGRQAAEAAVRLVRALPGIY